MSILWKKLTATCRDGKPCYVKLSESGVDVLIGCKEIRISASEEDGLPITRDFIQRIKDSDTEDQVTRDLEHELIAEYQRFRGSDRSEIQDFTDYDS